jgi:DNA-binding response OmpR family regulator
MRRQGQYGYPHSALIPARRFPVIRVKKNSQPAVYISQTFHGKAWILSINTEKKQHMERIMLKVAVIEDDIPTSNQLKGWIEAAKPGIRVDQWHTRDDAEAAIAREVYDLVVLDIELGRERHAGVAIINAINKSHATPVLVVSAMPATIYRSIMKALDAWDYLQKATFEESDFIDTFLEILRAAKDRSSQKESAAPVAGNVLSIDPLKQRNPIWRAQRINLPLTAQRILSTLYEHRGQVVTYEQLFQVVKSGRNRDNIRKHVSTIRDAFREVDPDFSCIENVPMRGFRWTDQGA